MSSYYGRIFLSLIISFAATTAMARSHAMLLNNDDSFKPSPYIGAQFGYGDMHYNQNDLNVTVFTERNNHYGARGYLGYSFTPHFSLETGFMYISDVRFFNLNAPNSGFDVRFQQYMIDLLAKISTPLWGKVGGFVKFGPMYVDHRADKTLGGTDFPGFPHHTSKIVPTTAIGFDYALNQKISADLTWQHSFSRGVVNEMDLVAIGLNYHFV